MADFDFRLVSGIVDVVLIIRFCYCCPAKWKIVFLLLRLSNNIRLGFQQRKKYFPAIKSFRIFKNFYLLYLASNLSENFFYFVVLNFKNNVKNFAKCNISRNVVHENMFPVLHTFNLFSEKISQWNILQMLSRQKFSFQTVPDVLCSLQAVQYPPSTYLAWLNLFCPWFNCNTKFLFW